MPKYEYTLIKSDRKTYTIKVTEDNKIIVRAPQRASLRDVENVIAGKRGWIERAMAFNSANNLARQSVKDYRMAYVGGDLVPVIKSTRNFIDGAGVHVTGERGFKSAYVGTLGGYFTEKFREVERACNLKAASVSFRSYTGRWGCCDGNCNIIFNFKLLMLPQSVQKYVMVHELCHTIHHDHSKEFWQLVSRFMPDWKRYRAELKKYTFLIRLY